MRLLLLAFLALPLLAYPLRIASDLGNARGFLDILKQSFEQDTQEKVEWVQLEPKHLCSLDGLLVSKPVLLSLKLGGEGVLQEHLFLLGKSAWAEHFKNKNALAILKTLQTPPVARHLKVMVGALKAYQPSDLILISERLYLQEKEQANLPPILYKPLRLEYFWASPCKSKRGARFLKWLLSQKAQESIQGFRVDYHSIFTPLERSAHGR